MEEIGYEYRNHFENVMPYRRYFTKPGNYHVHTVEVTGEFWRRHILFRDYMRGHDDVRDAYFKTKKELAEKDWNDINDYAYAKTEFVKSKEKEALYYFTALTEKTECEALNEMYSGTSSETKKKCGIQTKRIGTAVLIRTDIFPGFTHNRVPGLGLDNPLDEKTISEVKEFYSTSKYKHALQLEPSVITEEDTKLLRKHGYEHKNNWVRFYRDTSPIENVKTDLEIKPVGNVYKNEYGSLITNAFDFPAELSGLFEHLMENKNWKHFMAFEGSKPIATGSVYFSGNTAWIGFAATNPDSRGRGAQAAILEARINEARNRGCKWIAVETGEDTSEHDVPSYRNMLRYGFRLLYKRPNYVFEP
jgi:GNAT superfamily N-acetyltransferase